MTESKSVSFVHKIKIKRNKSLAVAAMFELTNTVSSDSIFGQPVGTMRISGVKFSGQVLKFRWDPRSDGFDLQFESQTFPVYDKVPHKYRLKRLRKQVR